nr:MAG TPA: hypothetical protein [Caudoviricetes sp.]
MSSISCYDCIITYMNLFVNTLFLNLYIYMLVCKFIDI